MQHLEDLWWELLELVGTIEQDARVTDIVVVNVYVDELDRKVGEIERNLGKGCLTQASATDLINTHYQPLDLLYVVGFKLKNIH